VIAFGTALFGLYRRRLPQALRAAGLRWVYPPINGLRQAHTGLVGDYITWLAVGTATLGTIWVLALR
jgi:hypothetical protein